MMKDCKNKYKLCRKNAGLTQFYASEKLHISEHTLSDYSLLSSVRLNGDTVPFVFEGALNGDLFKAYIAQCLAPTLKKGDIVIMDNLTSHKVAGVVDPIIAAGTEIVYLPPYSPDFNPIEMMWSKIKAYLRKVKARTKDSLEKAIADALDSVTTSDILAWFKESGYSTH